MCRGVRREDIYNIQTCFFYKISYEGFDIIRHTIEGFIRRQEASIKIREVSILVIPLVYSLERYNYIRFIYKP